ncbi:PD40 domain-containing protein [Aquimarina sp. MMG016]|uniref:PD40 domain-containing protein n=1 Tax=Aquimarina sp. MMG016 TaxID=2822690 RepID=UPI001B3A38F3|nr:PD40 domain-containing protein [Aquimarina sp. MMG016]MBQ4819073.1 PD40 domain-containing protein [Aquimarina sp. MMG016]
MKGAKFTMILFTLISQGMLLVLISCKDDSKQLKPQVFEPGNISTTSVEYATTFSIDDSEVYFAKSNNKWGTSNMKSSIYYSVKENGEWSTPKLASFSGKYDDSGPHISNNGKTLYFISKRPSKEVTPISKDIWKVEKDKNGTWGVPIRLNDAINSEKDEYSPCTDKYGNLYFASNRLGGYGQGDLYIAKKEKDTFSSPINLGNTINSDKGEWNLEVNNDGNIIIFESSGREQNLSSYGDLYISFKINDQWSIPQNIKEINTTGSDLYAELIEDDRLLYYTSSDSLKSTHTNIYSIEFAALNKKYRKNAVLSKQ